MSNKKPTVAERAVRGCLGGWVWGSQIVKVHMTDKDGYVLGNVDIIIPPASVSKMLRDEATPGSACYRGKKPAKKRGKR